MKNSRPAMRHLAEVAFIEEIQHDFFESLTTEDELREAEADLTKFLAMVEQRENGQPGEALAIFRAERRLTQAQMATMMSVSRRTYQYYEAGKQEISIGPLILLYARYGLDLNELLSGDPIEPSLEHNLDVVAWTLEVRKFVQGLIDHRGIRPRYFDEIVDRYARLRQPSDAVNESDLTAFVFDWLEEPTPHDMEEQNAKSRTVLSKKKSRRKSPNRGFRIPDIPTNKETASYPRKRRYQPKAMLDE